IRTRMLTNEQIVRAGAAHVAATPNLTRKGWHDFVAQMGIDQYPGLQAIAFAESVPAGAKRAHVSRMRSEGLRDYEIAPHGARPLGGFVIAVFRMGDLMRGIVDASAIETLDLRIYDGAPDVAAAELLDTRAAWRDARGPFAPLFTRRAILPAAGRTWTIVFT